MNATLQAIKDIAHAKDVELDRLRALNAELVELLADIALHLSSRTALHPGSLIFAEDAPAVDAIKRAIIKAKT